METNQKTKREDGFYWIKWDKKSEWEVCKYNSETDYFYSTNGSRMNAKTKSMEINEVRITNNN